MRRLVVLAALCCTALFTSSALAQDPAISGYGGVGGDVQGGVEGAGAGQLPFTGFDVFLAFLAGAVLVALGLTLRRLSRART